MSATGTAAESGVILGLVSVLLSQQLAILYIGSVLQVLEYLVVGAIAGGIVCAPIGLILGHRYRRTHPDATLTEWKEPRAGSP